MRTLKIIVITGALLLFGCTRPDHTKELLEAQGYKNVVITGYDPFGCGEDGQFATGFTATNPNGKQVSGVVCDAFNKYSTVRFK